MHFFVSTAKTMNKLKNSPEFQKQPPTDQHAILLKLYQVMELDFANQKVVYDGKDGLLEFIPCDLYCKLFFFNIQTRVLSPMHKTLPSMMVFVEMVAAFVDDEASKLLVDIETQLNDLSERWKEAISRMKTLPPAKRVRNPSE